MCHLSPGFGHQCLKIVSAMRLVSLTTMYKTEEMFNTSLEESAHQPVEATFKGFHWNSLGSISGKVKNKLKQ